MPVQLIQGVNARALKLLLILVFSLLINGCDSSQSPEFGTGLVFPGSENVISLGGFWFNIEGNGVSQTDRITPAFDPIGGYLFLYWLDEGRNVCHGQPGVSGQPGAAYVKAFQQQAYNLAIQGNTITTSQMLDFQKIPYRVDHYVANTQASGLHFIQYGNVIARSRNDGIGFKYVDNIYFSVPLIISVDTTNTLFPYFPDKQVVCSKNLGPPLPHIDGPGQDPNMCGSRVLPVAVSMNYQESLNYCLINVPQGTIWTYIP
jgi:hypothetical protein